MFVARLELHQFRNYAEADVRLAPGVFYPLLSNQEVVLGGGEARFFLEQK